MTFFFEIVKYFCWCARYYQTRCKVFALFLFWDSATNQNSYLIARVVTNSYGNIATLVNRWKFYYAYYISIFKQKYKKIIIIRYSFVTSFCQMFINEVHLLLQNIFICEKIFLTAFQLVHYSGMYQHNFSLIWPKKIEYFINYYIYTI